MKKLIPGFIIAFVSGFMFFFYEPLIMYATNRDDFWFDIYLIIKPTIIMFIAYVLLISVVLLVIYFFNKKLFKGKKLYEVIISIGFALLIAFYIQGNFFAGGLPSLDGSKIEWEKYHVESIISAVIFIIPLVVTFIVMKKFEFEKYAKVYSFISIAICIMLSTSLLSTAMSNDISAKKGRYIVATEKNINSASENKNFYILLLDAVDSKTFDTIINESGENDIFKDFTYYPDTVCGYPFTRDSIPFILSGIWNENETEFNDYFNNAMDKSELIDKLIEKKYNINIYDDEFDWDTEKVSNVDNMYNIVEIKNKEYYNNVIEYVSFKYLPYFLKRYSSIEKMNFNNCKSEDEYENFTWENKPFYDKMKENNTIKKMKENYFSFIHLEGGHVEFDLDKDLNEIENGTYEQKVEACITLTKRFINRLKENGVYDNSVIIVLADHGYNSGYFKGRQNPILYIKGIDEHHDKITSDIPVSYDDLQGAYLQLIEGKKSEDLFKNIDRNRKRRFILYEYGKEDNMTEYEQIEKADNIDTLIPTGREFNR